MSKELTIVVAGKAMTGKTTIAQIIEDALKAKGLSVKLFDDEKPTREKFNERVEALKNKTHVILKTVQVSRDLTPQES